MKLLPGPPLSVMGLRCWLSAHKQIAVVTAMHNSQAAVLCKPALQEPLCLLTTSSAKLGKEQRRALAHSFRAEL